MQLDIHGCCQAMDCVLVACISVVVRVIFNQQQIYQIITRLDIVVNDLLIFRICAV